jgi:2-oxoisovalerate ferredoxin oxidoreductase beta subunit
MIKYGKPAAFYETFERKAAGQKVTHYCPGCGHGTAHKLLAELISELGIQDRTILCSPVGCSVFAYYYFDTGNIQCSHGRAPAVATGIRRSREDAIVISYQGDGDLAGIGTAEIIHAANRGENISVFFINNAIYGMTGGQMAPTTILRQKTTTTPKGRSLSNEGVPIVMAEVINALNTPVFIERVSLADAPRILKARKAFKKALVNQIEKRGFSFVEVLSPCPVSWRMSPQEARKWLIEQMEPVFPVRNFRDLERPPGKAEEEQPESRKEQFLGDRELLELFSTEKEPELVAHKGRVRDQFVKIAGFGGQGVMSAGVLMANCATHEGLNATWLPSYGPEMRGGTANASVVISEQPIGSPVVGFPNVLIAMNGPSLDSFEQTVAPGAMIIVNSSLVTRKVKRKDVKAIYVPAADMARELGFTGAANMVVLAVYLHMSKVLSVDTLKQIIPVSIKRKQYIDVNLKAVEAGVGFCDEKLKAKSG